MPLPHPLVLTQFLNIYEEQLKQRSVLGQARDLLSWQLGWNNPQNTLQSSAEFKTRFKEIKTEDQLIDLIIELGDKADEVQAKSYNYSAFSETLHAIRSYCLSKADQDNLHRTINKRYADLAEPSLEPRDRNRFSKYIIYLNADEFCLNTKFIEELFPRNKYQYLADATLPTILQKDFYTQYLTKHCTDSLDPIADLEQQIESAASAFQTPQPTQTVALEKPPTDASVFKGALTQEMQAQEAGQQRTLRH